MTDIEKEDFTWMLTQENDNDGRSEARYAGATSFQDGKQRSDNPYPYPEPVYGPLHSNKEHEIFNKVWKARKLCESWDSGWTLAEEHEFEIGVRWLITADWVNQGAVGIKGPKEIGEIWWGSWDSMWVYHNQPGVIEKVRRRKVVIYGEVEECEDGPK